MMGLYSKNGMKASCTDYAHQPIGSVGRGAPEAVFDHITSIHSLIPTGVLCAFPAAADGKGLVVFGAYENAEAGSVATLAFVFTVLAFFRASRLRSELKCTPTTNPSRHHEPTSSRVSE